MAVSKYKILKILNKYSATLLCLNLFIKFHLMISEGYLRNFKRVNIERNLVLLLSQKAIHENSDDFLVSANYHVYHHFTLDSLCARRRSKTPVSSITFLIFSHV